MVLFRSNFWKKLGFLQDRAEEFSFSALIGYIDLSMICW